MPTLSLLDHGDFIQPFLIDHSSIRGRFVRMGPAIDEILHRHAYPTAVSRLLAEQIVLAAMLAANLKTDGILTVQASGDGPVKYVVADVEANGKIRGYANMREGAEAEIEAMVAQGNAPTLESLIGKGYLAITLDPGEGMERHQGIVPLEGVSLSDALKGYFVQSQQVEMSVKVAISNFHDDEKGDEGWRASGIIIERMPQEGGVLAGKEEEGLTVEERDDQWVRARIFLDSLTQNEMLDPHLSPRALLFRLYNEDGVWVYDPKELTAGCRCSRERAERILASLPEEDIEYLKKDGKITITCQFCNESQVFEGI